MTTTNVWLVVDQSESMRGGKTAMQQQMVWEMVKHFGEQVRDGRGGYSVSIIGAGPRVEEHSLRQANMWTRPEVEAITACKASNTPLYDAIGKALECAEQSRADADLVAIFSDGEENASQAYRYTLPSIIQRVMAKGKLTLTFAGPASASTYLAAAGIPAGNFKAWDGSEAAMPEVAQVAVSAATLYTDSRAKGVTRSATLYADASKLTTGGVRGMTKKVDPVEQKTVSKYMDGRAIADFFKPFKPGAHYYQLVKPEYIQEDKELVVHIKDQNEYRQGSRTVRMLLGLPETGRIRVAPGKHSDKFDIYVQSSSVNRKLVEGQKLLTL